MVVQTFCGLGSGPCTEALDDAMFAGVYDVKAAGQPEQEQRERQEAKCCAATNVSGKDVAQTVLCAAQEFVQIRRFVSTAAARASAPRVLRTVFSASPILVAPWVFSSRFIVIVFRHSACTFLLTFDVG